jgi:hypothetical protein
MSTEAQNIPNHHNALYLRAYKAPDIYVPISHLYICKESSTNQPFYAKQTQFPKKSNDVSFFYTMDYENKRNWTIGQSKPNSNPIKPNLPEGKIDAKCVFTKDHEEKCG